MVTAKFGSKQFKVTPKMIYTPSDFATSESIDIEETERSGKKPSVKVKGIKLQTASFAVLLDARFVNVASEIQWWKNTLRAKSPKDLYLGNYKIGKFYLTQYDISDIQINKSGVYTKAKLSLSFTEYTVGGGDSSNANASASSVMASASNSKKIEVGTLVKLKKGTYLYPDIWSAQKKLTSGALSANEYLDRTYKVTYVGSGSVKGVIGIIDARSNGTTWKMVRAEDVTLST